MKNIRTIILLSLLAMMSSALYAGGDIKKRTVVTLRPGETILTMESCLSLSAQGEHITLAVTLGEDIYVYKDGKRLGPYADFRKAEEATEIFEHCGGDNDCMCDSFEDDGYASGEMVDIGMDGMLYISFKGKKIGPYAAVDQVIRNSSKTKFYALVTKGEVADSELNGESFQTRTFVVSETGREVPVFGSATTLVVSPSFSKAYWVATEEDTYLTEEAMNQEVDIQALMEYQQKLDALADLPEEEMLAELTKLAKEFEQSQGMGGQDHDSSPQKKMMIQGFAHPSYGPYLFSDDYIDLCFRKDSDQVFFLAGNVLYLEGREERSYKSEDYIHPCEVYFSADGSRHAVATYDKLIFSDGTVSMYPLKITSSLQGGQVVLKWVTLENNTGVVVNERVL